MENVSDYFSRTENTVRMLLEENQACQAKVKLAKETVILSSTTPEAMTPQKNFGNWWMENKNNKTAILEAQQSYSIEAFAGGLLAGSVLSIAARAIDNYSQNTAIPDNWGEIFRKESLPTRFFVGRTIHTVPLGLIIYAGWNQYIDHISREIRIINHEVFLRVATHSEIFEFQAFAAREHEFVKLHYEYFASHVLDVLCWNDYDQYIKDMQQALP